LGLVALVVLLLVIAVSWQSFASIADRRAYLPPEKLVDVGDYRLHILCQGEGSPTVILDALGDGTSAHWGWVQPAVAKVTRVCDYDRAGRGWIDPSVPTDESRQVFSTMQQELLPLSTNSAYREVKGASHASLVLDEAHAAQVAAGIVEVVEAARNGTSLMP
jgi:hypothetical protein